MKIKFTGILVFFIFVFIHYTSIGQSYKSLVNQGDSSYNKKNYFNAAKAYNQAYKLVKRPGLQHLEMIYKYGYCEMQNTNYAEAINLFNSYLLINENTGKIKNRRQVIEWIKYCEPKLNPDNRNGVLPGHEKIVQIINLYEINSNNDDYTPFYYTPENWLLFASGRESSIGFEKIGGKGGDIYYTAFKDGKFSSPLPFGKYFNTPKQDLDPFITGNGEYFYYSRADYYDILFDNSTKGKIYMATKGPLDWKVPLALSDKFNTDSWNGNIFISSDESFLFFSSDREGGFGGKDIYYCIKNKETNSWSDPKNIGAPINTQYDEITPKYYPDQKVLFFSSRGHASYGGYDIFFCTMNDDGSWSEPKNFGTPINSVLDDICFIKAEKTDPIIAFMASNREGGLGGYDIYRLVFTGTLPIKEKIIDTTIIAESEQIDSLANDSISGADITTKVTNIKDHDTSTKVSNIKVHDSTTKVITTQAKDKTVKETKPDNQITHRNAGLYLKVQIGAYSKSINISNIFIHIDPNDIEEVIHNNLYKYLIKEDYKDIKSALKRKNEIKKIGYFDVWIVPYNNGERISLKEFKRLMRKK